MISTTRITTPFGHDSTAAEVIAGVDLTGKRAIVTGSASGIGVETARALSGIGLAIARAIVKGARVVVAWRNAERLQSATASLGRAPAASRRTSRTRTTSRASRRTG